MRHLHPLSRRPALAQQNSDVSGLESIIMLLLGIFFGGWDNYAAVSSNLQKFYAKTPE